ncbi:phosphoenolpyruvate--protein phosphotransferase [Sansalvadorimonas sp. 2012CJ34-2]|uniref:phosphoenolpyruvate--protein phosphotransferase n=1 Tax=Parendozoicomonas callyspongiae TaxID=2942213 RepID=A0ABT0PGB3_9GAMM|nr:phosphoenolpyruvate--protein phosphotransferase [Sansalvadorimonas sp. 2012CJ34-2]MCL6270383.1 phosphoenolpyruvate--protein phosphotransferase [Sansalvadorimonas sp. 2012CJ34-2]
MLSTLRRIVQEVGTARDLQAALDIIVRSVRLAMCTDVCSVYLYDDDADRYTLMASEGLNRKAIGRVTLSRSEGLVGQVGLREEPINLEDAASHPKFRYLEETGEERFRSFLGVPIIHHRNLLGVLVVQQAVKRRFDESEESFLVTMSAQLAGVIAHAEATGSLHIPSSSHEKPRQSRFMGVAGSPGIAIGTAVVLAPPADLAAVPEKETDDIDGEIQLFRQALCSVRDQMSRTAEKLAGSIPPEEQALFDVYLRMLDDNALGAEVETAIKKGQWAQGALREVIEEHVGHFEKMDDPYLRERAVDVRDLGRRVLASLQQQQAQEVTWPDEAVVISEELTPAMLGEIPRHKLVGLVSVQGSGNSHVAILARAMGVPTIMGAVDLPWERVGGRELIVDGNLGRVYASPAAELVSQYRQLIDEEQAFVEGLEALKDEPCLTPDHYRLPLWVNTGLMTDTVRSLDKGAEGVGLYRTEVPFMIRERFPSEKEQEEIYRDQLKAFAPKPVTIRTLDIGGDKSLSYFPIKEENPFLGWRGIRVTLDHPEIFLVQIRAMLKASAGLDNLRIMLPMISGVPEVEEALYLIHRAYHEVLSEGVDVQLPPIGVMVEVPAAVYQVKDFARRVDFLSIGSNDLTQYILAVDRNNPRVAELYHSFHPAVLQALQKVVNDAHKEGKPVSICGEMAGDPAAAVLLMAMGFDILSMNATHLPRVKWALRNIPLEHAKEILDDVMEMDNPRVIRSAVELALRHRGLEKVLAGRADVAG